MFQYISGRHPEREKKMSKQPPPAPTESTVGPCPTIIQISRTPRHWESTQHHRTTQLPPIWPDPIGGGWAGRVGQKFIYGLGRNIDVGWLFWA